MTSLSSINDLLKHNDIVSLTFDKWLKCTQVLPHQYWQPPSLYFTTPLNIYLQPERP